MHVQATKLILSILLIIPLGLFAQEEFELSGNSNRTHTYRNNTGVTSTDLEYRGKIVFTDDETDVKYISPGRFLKFSKRSFGNKRTIILEGEAKGEIFREYYEGHKKLPFEPDGRKWMASVLPEIIRSTGIGAEERARKFYRNGGINALLEEIALLPSNYVKGKYYDASFKISGLKDDEMVSLIEDAGEEINSSYELGKIITGNSEAFSNKDLAVAAAINVTSEISSSYEQAKVYKHLLTKANLSSNNKTLVIKNVREINSGYEQSGVLQAILKDELSTENVRLVIGEVGYISSSYEQSKVLQYLIKNQSFDDLDLNIMLNAVSKISSSYEQGKVLRLLVDQEKLSSEQIITIAKATKYISSGYEKSKFLQSIIGEQELDEASINAVLAITSGLSSSYEKSKVLQLIIASDNFDDSNFAAVIKASTTIGSSYEQSKVLAKVIALNSMSDTHLLVLIKAIDGISSKYEKSKLLQKLGPQLPANIEVRDAFFEAAESLSDYEYGKVMRTARK